MGVRRLGMNVRPIGRILLVVLAAAAVAVSCTYDYWLDFELGDIGTGSNYVDVDYSMTNSGSKSMYNASIRIQVSADVAGYGTQTLSEWLPLDGVDLSSFDAYTDTYQFTFSDVIDPASVMVEIVGTRWDDSTVSD
jgi:hypothetical protein